MVQEIVELSIRPEDADAFEAAIDEARLLFEASPGCGDFTLMRSVEHAGTYRLCIMWAAITDHMEGFRNSDAFPKWRALVSPWLARPLSMQHFETVAPILPGQPQT